MTTRGVCKLCTLEKDLQDSHFIGKAVYRKLKEPSIRSPRPIVIRPRRRIRWNSCCGRSCSCRRRP